MNGERSTLKKQGKKKSDSGQGIVRPMSTNDLGAVLDIEQSSFPTPWSLHTFSTELRDNEYARYFCLEVDGKVAGYMGLWFIIDEGHITNIAIGPGHRHQGWGKFLLSTVMGWMAEKGMERMTLEVRASNYTAQKLYEQLGFVKAGLRRGYYVDNQEDAIIMWAELTEGETADE